MNYQEFMDEILKQVRERYPDSDVDLRKVTKVNNMTMYGLNIRSDEMNVVPTIYLESFYEMYQQGMTLEDILIKIQEVYKKGLPQTRIDMSFFKEFDKVKDRIIYRLINAEQNTALLQNIPHIRFLDLAICFMYDFRSDELGRGTILIHNSHMECWGVDANQLMELAEVNTPKLLPIVFQDMKDTLRPLLKNVRLDSEFESEFEFLELGLMYVLTNMEKIHGAAAILYPRALEYVASVLKSDYFVIPSSAHEVLIVPIKEEETIEEQVDALHAMIMDVNKTQVLPEDVLSDRPYLYRRTEGQLSLV